MAAGSLNGAYRAARGLWRGAPVPPSLRRGVRQAVASLQARAMERRCQVPDARSVAAGPLTVAGLLQASHGVAQSARAFSEVLDRLGVPHELLDVSQALLDPFAPFTGAPSRGGAFLAFVNAPETVAALTWASPRLRDTVRVGYWAWELPVAPRSWRGPAATVDRLWAPSRFVADALAGITSRPVTVMPPYVPPLQGADAVAARRAFDLPEDAFVAVSFFDVRSSLARKNPEGAVEAFRRAFGGRSDVLLVFKANGVVEPERDLAPLSAAIRAAGINARLVAGSWERAKVLDLLASSDVLLSMHRSEGFGLTLMEAMRLGRPVIAAGWSGPADFLQPDACMMIPHRLVDVVDAAGRYQSGQWAEPDPDAAAEALRDLAADPARRGRLAEAGARAASEFYDGAAYAGELTDLGHAPLRSRLD